MSDTPSVTFGSPETLISTLDGYGVTAYRDDGFEVTGIIRPFKPELFAEGVFMVSFHRVIGDELMMATDIRNFGRITVE